MTAAFCMAFFTLSRHRRESDASGSPFKADGDTAFANDDRDSANPTGEFQHFGEPFRLFFNVEVQGIRIRRPGAVGVRSPVFSVNDNFRHNASE